MKDRFDTMFPIPPVSRKDGHNSKKTVIDMFKSRTKNTHDKTKSISEIDLRKLAKIANDNTDGSSKSHLLLNQKNDSRSLCEFDFLESNIGIEKFDDKLNAQEEYNINADKNSQRCSLNEFQTLQPVDEEKPLKTGSKSLLSSNRKFSKIVFHRPKKIASSMIKGNTKLKKSVSDSDFFKLNHDHNLAYNRPSSGVKRSSVERQRNPSLSGSICSLYSDSCMAYQRKRSWSFDAHPDCYDDGSIINVNEKAITSKNESPDLQELRIELSKCKEDINEFKSKFYSFKEEVHIGINKLYTQIKIDEERFSKLCNKIDHITNLHQVQMKYLESLITSSEKDRQSTDSFVFNGLSDHITALEKRISKLRM